MGSVVGSAAGAPLSQASGPEAERLKKEASAQSREIDGKEKAEKTSGIGQTEQDEGASDRDADGRQFWQQAEANSEEQAPAEPPHQVKDPTGNSGNSLDLTGWKLLWA